MTHGKISDRSDFYFTDFNDIFVCLDGNITGISDNNDRNLIKNMFFRIMVRNEFAQG